MSCVWCDEAVWISDFITRVAHYCAKDDGWADTLCSGCKEEKNA